MIFLRPIREKASDYDEIEKEIQRVFREEIYSPLMEEIDQKKVLRNTLDDLAEAIRSGRIVFDHGRFIGSFDSVTSRELRKIGAKWDRSSRSYRISARSLPIELKPLIWASESRFEKTINRINSRLAQILPEEIAGKVKLENLFDKRIWSVDSDLKSTMKGLTVVPQLTKERAKVISEDYTNNMKLYIQEWTEKEIKELRQKMQVHSFKGLRYEGMIKEIQKSYDVSKKKAKFLARQETSLLMTGFKQQRYQEAGVRDYKWRCVVGTTRHPVRPMHKKLDGKMFSFDNPPVTSPNGARNNPGQDYNCRCVAVPIVKFG